MAEEKTPTTEEVVEDEAVDAPVATIADAEVVSDEEEAVAPHPADGEPVDGETPVEEEAGDVVLLDGTVEVEEAPAEVEEPVDEGEPQVAEDPGEVDDGVGEEPVEEQVAPTEEAAPVHACDYRQFSDGPACGETAVPPEVDGLSFCEAHHPEPATDEEGSRRSILAPWKSG